MKGVHEPTIRHHALRLRIAVVGAAVTDSATREAAQSIGYGLASAGAIVICGGGGGVMEGAARGCRQGGGLTVGILAGVDNEATPPNPFIDIPIFTGIGQARNLAVVLTADAIIAIGGGWGTLSEIALARKHGRSVVVLGDWSIQLPDADATAGVYVASSPQEAIQEALDLADGGTKP